MKLRDREATASRNNKMIVPFSEAHPSTMKNEQPLVVTTAHRGVFFGYGNPAISGQSIRLERARMCVYWSADVKGVVGLAANGPTTRCKISPAAPAIILEGVTAIMEVSGAAAKQWEAEPWS